MAGQKTFIIGSRKSLLAMTQAQTVVCDLKKHFPEYRFIIKKIVTSGDRLKSWDSDGLKGLFVKEIEEALIAGEIDIAVHSMKDLPVEIAEGLEIAAVTKRVDSRDVLISASGKGLDNLSGGSLIGTSSPRRRSQLLLYRPDFKICDIRGNIGTRIEKLKQKKCDAIVIAAAGIVRLGLEKLINEYIPEKIMLPACGQGVLGIQIRKSDRTMKTIVKKLNHPDSRAEAEAERQFLFSMGGGCRVPIAARAKVKAKALTIEGLVADEAKGQAVRAKIKGQKKDSKQAGEKLAKKIIGILKNKDKKGAY